MKDIFARPPTDEEHLRQIILEEVWHLFPTISRYQLLTVADTLKAKIFDAGYRHGARAKLDRE